MELSDVIAKLSPANRRVAEQLIKSLAEQEGIAVRLDSKYPPILKSVELWIASLVNDGKSPHTIRLYEFNVRHFLASASELTPLALQAYVAGHLKTKSAAFVNGEKKSIRSFFKFAVKEGLQPVDIARDIAMTKERSKEVECPPDESILVLLTTQLRRKKDWDKFRVIITLLIDTGLRIEEAFGLRRANINYEAREIKVLGKGNKERTVPVCDLTAAILLQYMKDRPTDSPFLFPSSARACGYEDADAFRKTMKRTCKRVGIKSIHPHQLRHYFATKTLEHGAKLEVISRILGHANVGITAQVYRHIRLKEFHAEHTAHAPLQYLPKMLPQGKGGDASSKDT